MMLIFGLIGYYILKSLAISVFISHFRKLRNKIDIIMNLLSFSVTSIFHVILVEKQPIKHHILSDCLTFNFRHRSEYKSFESVWRGLTEHRREHPIRITCPCNEHPLTPHFYIEKVGFTWVYIFFLLLLQNIDCGYSLEPPQ